MRFLCLRGCAGSGVALEKAGCVDAKAMFQPKFTVSAIDIKDPSTEGVALGRNFYSDIWLAGGREMIDEAIRDSEGEVLFESKPCPSVLCNIF
jgi:hypothetical protein